MIYYTKHEAGIITPFPVRIMHQKAIKELRRNRRVFHGKKATVSSFMTDTDTGLIYPDPSCTHAYSMLRGIKVDSVFFIRNGRITKIWDARLNGYRPKYRYWSKTKL